MPEAPPSSRDQHNALTLFLIRDCNCMPEDAGERAYEMMRLCGYDMSALDTAPPRTAPILVHARNREEFVGTLSAEDLESAGASALLGAVRHKLSSNFASLRDPPTEAEVEIDMQALDRLEHALERSND